MTTRFWLRAVVTWALLALLAVGTGALRDTLYVPLLGRAVAEALTLAKLLALWGVITYGFLAWHRAAYRRVHLPWLGGLWLALAVLLEYALSQVTSVRPESAWAHLHAWWRGDLWVVAVAALYFLPLLAGRLVRPPRLGPAGHELRERD